MMYKQKSGGGRKFKALALVPMLAISLGIAAVPAVQAAVITISSSSVSGSKVNENLANGQPSSKVFKVVNINKDGDKTALTINGTDLGNSLTVSGGTITANGKTYDANGLQCNMTDGTAVIKAVFPSVEDWEKASLTLNVNGKDIVFNLDDFLANAQTVEVNNGSTKPAKIIVINGENSMQVDAMEISIDGKKVTKEEMDKLPSDKIQSIDVNRQNNTIKIVLKK